MQLCRSDERGLEPRQLRRGRDARGDRRAVDAARPPRGVSRRPPLRAAAAAYRHRAEHPQRPPEHARRTRDPAPRALSGAAAALRVPPDRARPRPLSRPALDHGLGRAAPGRAGDDADAQELRHDRDAAPRLSRVRRARRGAGHACRPHRRGAARVWPSRSRGTLRGSRRASSSCAAWRGRRRESLRSGFPRISCSKSSRSERSRSTILSSSPRSSQTPRQLGHASTWTPLRSMRRRAVPSVGQRSSLM